MEAHIVDDRTFVPLRFISEKMDADVDWDEATKTIDIKDNSEKPDNGGHEGMPGGGITAGAEGDRKPLVEMCIRDRQMAL